MNIQCIALDLDRTTLNRQGKLSDRNRQALEYAIGKGIHVVIASGRPFAALPGDVISIPGIEYAITSNGAAVYYVPTGMCLHSYTLSGDSVRDILELTKGDLVAYEVSVAGNAYADVAYIRDPVKYGATPEAITYIQSTRHLEEDMIGFIHQHIDELESMDIIVRDRETKECIETRLRRAVPDIYITSTVQQLLEISHKNAGKHCGIRYITEHLQLPQEAVAAFGDGDNDTEMLSYVGYGIAVENASPACLAAADYVTRSHQEDGVAYGIYEILRI